MKTSKEIAEKITPVLLNFGGAKKFIADMSPDELETARKSILRRAKEKAFSKGLPIYYTRNRKLIAEYPDGKTIIIRK